MTNTHPKVFSRLNLLPSNEPRGFLPLTAESRRSAYHATSRNQDESHSA